MHCSADCIVVPAGGLAGPIREPMDQGMTRAYRLPYRKQYKHSNEDQISFRSSFPSCLPLGRWWIQAFLRNGTADRHLDRWTNRQRATKPSWVLSSWVLPQRDCVASLASVSWRSVERERQRSARVVQKAVSRGCSPHRRLRAMYHSVCIACIPCCDGELPRLLLITEQS